MRKTTVAAAACAMLLAGAADAAVPVKFGCATKTEVDCFARTSAGVAMNDVAANAAAGSQTFVIDVVGSGVSTVTAWIDVTEVGAITAVTLTCSGSPNNGTTYGQLTSTTVAAGVGTIIAYSDSYALTTSGVLQVDYDVSRYDKFKCLVGITGGGATDTYDVHVTGSAGL